MILVMAEHSEKHSSLISYSCTICDKDFIIELHLSSGTQPLEEEKPYPCDICGKRFISKSALHNHKRYHAQTKPYVCNECGRGYVSRSELKNHILIHTGERPHTCSICGKDYRRMSNLNLHKKTQHEASTSHTCGICAKSFETRSSLTKHSAYHTGLKPFSCDVCGMSFVREAVLTSHFKVHKQKPYGCKICCKSFAHEDEFVFHSRIHGEKPLTCNICGKTYKNKKRFAHHSRIHDNKEEKLNSCNVCGLSFTLISSLVTHGLKHSELYPYVCSICGKSFDKESTFQKHTTSHKKRAKRHVCSICNKSFTSKSLWNSHVLKHENVNVEICHICRERFIQDKSLRHHMKFVHKALYPCKLCGHAFMKYGPWKDHMTRDHKGKKRKENYFCKVCRKVFDGKAQLISHNCSHSQIKNDPSLVEEESLIDEPDPSLDDNSLIDKPNPTSQSVAHKDLQSFLCSTCRRYYTSQSEFTRHFSTCREEKNPSQSSLSLHWNTDVLLVSKPVIGTGQDSCSVHKKDSNQSTDSKTLLSHPTVARDEFDVKESKLLLSENSSLHERSEECSSHLQEKELVEISNLTKACDHPKFVNKSFSAKNKSKIIIWTKPGLGH